MNNKNIFMPMRKDVKQGLIKSHEFMLRAGMIEQLGSGLFVWLPLGVRVLNKVTSIVHKWHKKLGFNECLAPNLQPVELWQESGRYDAYGKEMMRVIDRHGKELVLGPTAEEVFAFVARSGVTSEKMLPINLYNIQWKYRDEIRPRFGLMRCREFYMCDGYSFHINQSESAAFYDEVLAGYVEMFKEIGFPNPIPIQQLDTGAVGGSVSHEIFAESDTAEDEIQFERDDVMVTARGIELGHVYQLGTKYSEPMKLQFGGNPVWMGCYGVGVSRLIPSLIEVLGTTTKMTWPVSIAPFKVHLIGCKHERVDALASLLRTVLKDEAYIDVSDKGFGEKMTVADLIGAPCRIIAMQREIDNGYVVINNEKFSIHDDPNFKKITAEIFTPQELSNAFSGMYAHLTKKL